MPFPLKQNVIIQIWPVHIPAGNHSGQEDLERRERWLASHTATSGWRWCRGNGWVSGEPWARTAPSRRKQRGCVGLQTGLHPHRLRQEKNVYNNTYVGFCLLVNSKIYCSTLQSILTSLGQQILILISTEVDTCLLLTSTFRHLPTILMGISWQAKWILAVHLLYQIYFGGLHV